MKVLLLGSNGQLGSAILNKLKKECKVISPSKKSLNFLDPDATRKINKINFDYLINCVALQNLDFAEKNPLLTFKINTDFVLKLSKICKKKNAVFVHFSTDYVYKSKRKLNRETDKIKPLNIYALSKENAEKKIKSNHKKFFIFRIASLFGIKPPSGKKDNFIDSIIKKANKNEKLKIVNNQFMSPTSAKLVAEVIEKLIKKKISKYGIYNLASDGKCSWYEFANKILKIVGIKNKIIPVKYNQLKLKIKRPLNTSLDISKVKRNFKINIKKWDYYLQDYLKEKKYVK